MHDYTHYFPGRALHFTLSELGRYRNEAGILRVSGFHKTLIDKICARAEDTCRATALPVEFARNLVLLESGEEIPTTTFQVADMLELIAFMIQARSPHQSYRLLLNPDAESLNASTRVNRIIVRAPEDLQVTTSAGFMFPIVYNLMLNSANAIDEQQYRDGSRALPFEYSGGNLPVSRSIVLEADNLPTEICLRVTDDGPGLSLDDLMNRIQTSLALKMNQEGPEVRTSDWYKDLKAQVGDEAEILIAWPKNPEAIRDLHVRTIMDGLLISALQGDKLSYTSSPSGLGLWGTSYLTGVLGGTIIATNVFRGGARFSVKIPKYSLGL